MKKDPIIRGPKQFRDGDGTFRITAHGGVHKMRGNAKAYFSLTGNVDELEGGRWLDHSGGCIHDNILQHWPELQVLADLHLSGEDGAPMYAEGNGMYWLGGIDPHFRRTIHGYHGGNGSSAKTPEQCQDTLRRHLRLTQDETVALVADMKAVAMSVSQYKRVWEDGAYLAVKPEFEKRVEEMRPRWKREAEDAIRTFNLQRYGDL